MLSNNLILSNNLTGPMETILEVGAEVGVMAIVANTTMGIMANQMLIIFMLDTNATTVTSMTIYLNSVLIDSLYSTNPSHSSKRPQPQPTANSVILPFSCFSLSNDSVVASPVRTTKPIRAPRVM